MASEMKVYLAEKNDRGTQLQVTNAEAIVRLLAGNNAPTCDGTYANGHDWCVLCPGEGDELNGHDERCPWRMAREYVGNNLPALKKHIGSSLHSQPL